MMKGLRLVCGVILMFMLLLTGCQRDPAPTDSGELPPVGTPIDGQQPTDGAGPIDVYPTEPLPADQLPADQQPLPTDPTLTPELQPIQPSGEAPSEPVPADQQPAPAAAARFTNLRFTPTTGAAPQSVFPSTTDEVCAVWDYNNLQPSDTIRRVWYKNGEVYVTREQTWDAAKYGTTGTVQDVCLYDRIDGHIDGAEDGIDSGQWRVEILLNNELLLSQEFIVE